MPPAFLLLVPTGPGRPLRTPTGRGRGGEHSEGPPRGLGAARCHEVLGRVNAAGAERFPSVSPEAHGHPGGYACSSPCGLQHLGTACPLPSEGHGHLVGDRAGIGTWVYVALAPLL